MNAGGIVATLLVCASLTGCQTDTAGEASGPDVRGRPAAPQLVIEAPDADQEFGRIWGALKRLPFYRQYGYNITLPDHPAFAPYRSGSQPPNEDQHPVLRAAFRNEVFRADDYAAALADLAESPRRFQAVAPQFMRLRDDWGFGTFSTYKVTPTLYGTGGSYDSGRGHVILKVAKQGASAGGRDPLETIVHEIVHIGIERDVVQRYSLSHPEKERLVDLMVKNGFSEHFPGYTLQSLGDSRLNPYITRAALADIPRAVAAYRDGKPAPAAELQTK